MDDTLNLPLIATFDVAGSNKLEYVKYDEGKVWINATQYFNNVPNPFGIITWVRPPCLWLQKRMGRRLDFDDVNWYLRICATI